MSQLSWFVSSSRTVQTQLQGVLFKAVGLPALPDIRESRQTPAMERVFPTSRGMTKIQLHNKCSVILEKYSDSLGQRQMHHFHLLIPVIKGIDEYLSG